jgi:hypothetical protein
MNHTDRQLLELAAKAAGLAIDKSPYNGGGHGNPGFDIAGNAVLDWHNGITWNPLTDSAAALGLAVKLHMCVDCVQGADAVHFFDNSVKTIGIDVTNPDPVGATRRAIVLAAAALASKP